MMPERIYDSPQTPPVLIGYRPNHGSSGSDGSGERGVRFVNDRYHPSRTAAESFWAEVLMFWRFIGNPELRRSVDGQSSDYGSIASVKSE
jgi:hypothetical protein